MSEITPHSDENLGPATQEEILAALFANMVIQQTNMAMMLLGKVAHPETGQFMQDVESAKMFIDQLEMLAAKTKGNLSREEDSLLKQALTAVRMAFVEAIGAPADAGQPTIAHQHSAEPPKTPEPVASVTPPTPQAVPSSPPPASAPAVQEDSRKKFSKKY